MNIVQSQEVKQKYLTFFENREHVKIPESPLVLKDDPTTLFVSAGMQPLISYLKGKKHPLGKRLTNSQPCFRTEDVGEVGDNRHTTYFEMLGNWSLGDYGREEQLPACWEFLTKELVLPSQKLYISVFEGNKDVPKDEESIKIWKLLGIKDDRIFEYPAEKNWWSRSGSPKTMSVGDIGGPDSEVFFDFDPDGKRNIHSESTAKDKVCHPNCPCGRFMEIGNSVFIQYIKNKDGSFSELPQKSVDFGGGLERLAAATLNTPDIFQIDTYAPTLRELEKACAVSYGTDEKSTKSIRVVADHKRAINALINQGVVASNKLHGYVLRRLIRRAIFHLHLLGVEAEGLLGSEGQIAEECRKFEKTLNIGLSKLKKAVEKNQEIDGKAAFDLYQNHGFPLELTVEILKESGKTLSIVEQQVFQKQLKKHQELSRQTSPKMFK